MDETPKRIDMTAKPTGIRQLNKLPLMIIGVAGVLIIVVISYALHERSKPITLEEVRTTIRSEVDETSVRALTDGYRGSYIEAEVEEESNPKTIQTLQVANQETLLPRVSQKAATPVKAPPPFAPRGKSVAEEVRVRQNAKRLQMYYGALEASLTVDFQEQTVGLQATTGGPATYQERRDPASGLGDAIRSALGGPEVDQNGQVNKNSFLKESVNRTPTIFGREMPMTDWLIRSGTVIPGMLITGLNSDLPGPIKAQVSRNVYDTASGRHLLIPQGTQLIGRYDSRVTPGQSRALVVWSRLVFPDGSAMELGNMSGTDMAGYAGFNDQVDQHLMKTLASALLFSIISASYAIATDDEEQSDNAQSAQQEVARQMSNTTNQLLRKNLNLQPTIRIRPGYRFNVFVSKDMQFTKPYVIAKGSRYVIAKGSR